MNRIILLGRLTKDTELRYTPSGKAVCQFTLAINRPYVNQNGEREADFIPIVIWGKQAELANSGLAKGQRCLVEGRLQIRSFEGKDKQKHYITEVIADHFEFIEKRTNNAGPATGYMDNASVMDEFASGMPFDEEIPY